MNKNQNTTKMISYYIFFKGNSYPKYPKKFQHAHVGHILHQCMQHSDIHTCSTALQPEPLSQAPSSERPAWYL